MRKTRDRLGDALVALMQERDFDAITVQDVLDRAGVARSTFYAHYRDKNDLFVSDVDEFLGRMATALAQSDDASRRLAPVREFFAHTAEMRPLYDALVASGRVHDFLDLAQGHFAAAINARLAGIGRPDARASAQCATAQALAGALLALLRWWMDRGAPGSAADMDVLYHRLAWGALDGTGGRDPSSGSA